MGGCQPHIPTVFVQMMVELLLETIVDSTVMWAEGEHGIPITRYFEHVRSLHVAGVHMAYSIMAVACMRGGRRHSWDFRLGWAWRPGTVSVVHGQLGVGMAWFQVSKNEWLRIA